MIVGNGEFLHYIKEELCRLGFDSTHRFMETENPLSATAMVIEQIAHGAVRSGGVTDIPVIYSFDFVKGAGVIVLFPGDDRQWLDTQNVRLWAAEYMAGYCAFWNVEGCDWLHEAMPAIKENRTGEEALKTAARICARIAAVIAVGRDVKRYPRFYLVESGERPPH